jgi:hypothetical protein
MKNFGKINNAFINLAMTGIITKDDKKIKAFKEYRKMIKEDKALNTLFMVYENIKNQTSENKAINSYIDKNVNFVLEFKNFNKKMKPLVALLSEHNVDYNKLKYPGMEMDRAITQLLTKQTARNLDKMIKARNFLTETIQERKPATQVTAQDLYNEMVTFNDQYKDLNEYEIALVKNIAESSDDKINDLIITIKKDTIDIINEELKNSDTNMKEKLLNVKEKLLFENTLPTNTEKIDYIKKLITLNKSFTN